VLLSCLDDMIRRHRHSGILVDANLLIVFLLGVWDRNYVPEFKRTRGYTADDVDVLKAMLFKFDRLVTTPSVLAEASNLLNHLPPNRRDRFFAHLAQVLPTAPFEERLVELPRVAGSTCFIRLGFTDATIDELGAAGCPVLTDDFLLYRHLASRDIEVVNFNNIRPM
jgi:hypothetical protein